MLAQGQSSSAKTGGLAADVSSGLIFLKKKKRLKYLKIETSLCQKLKVEQEKIWRNIWQPIL